MRLRLLQNMRTFRNWYLPYAERYGLVQLPEVQYRLRNGLIFSARTRTLDASMIKSVWVSRTYEPAVLKFPTAGTIVDIGGHIGAFALFAAHRAPSARVLTFEPEPANYRLLRHNVQQNSLANVETFNLAVAGSEGRRVLHVRPGPKTGGHSLIHGGEGAEVAVQCTTLNQIIETHRIERIDYLKLDCEGAEFEILPSLAGEHWPKLRQVAIELHPDPQRGGEGRGEWLAQLLRSHGMEVFAEVRPGYLFARRH